MTRQSLIDAGVPEHDHEGLLLWVHEGVYPGSFLRAVLENDLRQAVKCADKDNQLYLSWIVLWLYNHAPAECWGSPEAVSRWHAERFAAPRVRERAERFAEHFIEEERRRHP